VERDGEWTPVVEIKNNRKRLLEIPGQFRGEALRVRLLSSWGEKDPRLFSVDVLGKHRDDTVNFPDGPRWKDVIRAVPPDELLPPDTQAKGRAGHGA
jgi:hypothetical protein